MKHLWRYQTGWPELRHRVQLPGKSNRRVKNSAVVAVALLMLACGATLASLVGKAQNGIRAFTPLIDTLVAQGVLKDPARVAEVKQDVSDAVDVTGVLATDLQAAGDDRVLRSQAVRKGAAAWRVIYARGHFGLNEKILRAANIADGIFASLELFYGGPAPGASPNLPAGPRPQTEGELRKLLERQVKELEQATR